MVTWPPRPLVNCEGRMLQRWAAGRALHASHVIVSCTHDKYFVRRASNKQTSLISQLALAYRPSPSSSLYGRYPFLVSQTAARQAPQPCAAVEQSTASHAVCMASQPLFIAFMTWSPRSLGSLLTTSCCLQCCHLTFMLLHTLCHLAVFILEVWILMLACPGHWYCDPYHSTKSK